jgi:hypothetical protein
VKVRELIICLQEFDKDAEVWLGFEGVCDSAKSIDSYEHGFIVIISTDL